MKTLATTIIAVMLCLTSYGQDWIPLQSDETVTIYFAKIEHHSPSDGIDHERIVFRYENHTDEDVRLQFNRAVAYSPDGNMVAQEKVYRLTIPAHATIGYDVEKSHDKTYYLFSKDLKGTIKRSLLDFELTNLETF